jgi:hypothetical protein
MSARRVRLVKAADGTWLLRYVRYHATRHVNSGTAIRAEAEAMAQVLARSLEQEQIEKALRRPDWRPEGVEAPPPPPPTARFSNPPRLVR